MAKGKQNYRVVGLAANVKEADIMVLVRATSIENAKEEAIKKEPGLQKVKDLRVYQQGGWVRVA